MNFRRQGSGPPVVLIHGVGHHWQGWRPVIDLLARDFDVIAVDLPGFGRSAPLPTRIDPTIPAYADAVGHLLEDMGVRRPHVAGNSMGGAIALELALREFAASVTAFSPAGFWSTLERRYCQLSLGALARTPSALRPAVLRLARSGNGRRVVFAQLMAAPTRVPAGEAVSALEDAWGAPSFTAALDGFGSYAFCGPGAMPPDVPITIAWGKRDWLLPFRLQAPRARQRLPSAEHLTLGTGHLPYFDDPAAVAQTIRRTAARSNRASSGTPREVTASQPTVTASAPPVHQRG